MQVHFSNPCWITPLYANKLNFLFLISTSIHRCYRNLVFCFPTKCEIFPKYFPKLSSCFQIANFKIFRSKQNVLNYFQHKYLCNFRFIRNIVLVIIQNFLYITTKVLNILNSSLKAKLISGESFFKNTSCFLVK